MSPRDWMCWVAEGFGVGRLPRAPGTWGTLVGVGWTVLLLAAASGEVFAGGCVLGPAAAVWFCGVAARQLGRADPPSVVLDEIAAVPLCFAGWQGVQLFQTGQVLRPADLVSGDGWWVTLGIVLAFRFFDVLKPWPVRQSQAWPGGWGIIADDLLAAVYVNAVMVPLLVTFPRV